MGKGPFYHTGLQTNRDEIRGLVDGNGAGTHYYVDAGTGSDNNDGLSWGKAFAKYSKAIDAVTTNKNDVIHVNGVTEITETAMVSITKSRVHTVGHNGEAGHFGQGSRISIGVTTDTGDIACVQNTGTRNTFTGIKFSSANTLTQGLYAFAEGGEFTRFFNCHFYLSKQLSATTAAEFLHNGDSCMHYGCTFGSTANATVGAIIRPNIMLNRETITGKVCRDSYLEDCLFMSKAGNAAYTNIYGSGATDVERMLMLRECTFFNNPLSAGTPDDAVNFGAAQTTGAVLLKDCTSVDHTVMAAASVTIYVDGPEKPVFATTGVSVAS